ncbi:MAG: bifunctional (p)ppGpp synthetase/guanosine-3',5'-bis(diphosphate) 3'-pyrophosphohydrolase [Alphaproteobacteria bacterium CG_4_10_14_0_8_um_filter_53_9]|nr:MAG: bifunctional (p)ppGpp synthetase/guanosine-3',5'-bis(diphosphate) 3'-pyrophosphohydrolase [Alphaproteobacteria bacterium CG_4_10_14_0_8_um_filter_53_9]
MVRQYELIEQVRKYNPKADVGLLNRAYVYSMKAHGDQRRASGEAYLIHPLAVAEILADMRLDEASLAAGLLHDTLEDTLASYDELLKLFGKEVADLCEGVTKLSKISFEDKSVEQAENFRKLLLAMSQDIRVLLIKLADRLHNMRTIEAKKPESQKKTAKETMEIYAPLADRIGLHALKAELEDRAFKVLEPEEHANLSAKMEEWRTQDNLVGRVVGVLKDEFKKAGIKAEVNGREKAFYSIYSKMVRKSLAFDQLTDIVAYRVMVDSKRDCYEVLGLLHDRFKAIPGRFKDYISAPKPNGYQSLHTSVVGPFGNRMEVQIRTGEMHDVAENGVAAHWLYKPAKGGEAEQSKASPYRWLRGMLEQMQGVDDPKEFYENAKMELFSDNVYAFTPKGDLIALPRGATVLDFAFAVHSNVGMRTVSAKINGAVVPLRRQVDNGDMVEIVTSSNQTPNPGWREIVVSNRAKSAINRYLRTQERDEQVRLGREILDKASRRDGWHWDVKQVAHVAPKLPVQNIKDADDVFAALGQGRLFPRQIFDVLYPQDKTLPLDETIDIKAPKNKKKKGEESQNLSGDEAVGLEGIMGGMAVHFAKCCSPLPGEDVVGIISTGRGISVHMKTCKNLEQFADQPDRWLPVKWSKTALEGEARAFVCRLRFHLANDPGALASVASTVANLDANIVEIFTEHRGVDSTTVRCEIEIRTKDHLNRLITNLTALKQVLRVEKIYAWN